MANGLIHIYAGDGRGKSPAALGRAVQAAMDGKRVVMIQFLKGKGLEDCDFLKRLEPEIKLFCFEKSEENGINFAKKVLTTGECDLLILDEVLGLVERGIISIGDLRNLVEGHEDTDIILTGITLNNEISMLADEVSKIETVKS